MVIIGKPDSRWMDITMDMYKMEKITAFIKHKLEQFTSHLEKRIHYVTYPKPDFIFTDY